MDLSNIITQDSVKYDFEEEINIKVVSLNLTDFNQRFGSDIVLYYADEIFDSYEKSELADYFISTIPDLLFMVHNPTNNTPENWIDFINWKFEEFQNLETNQKRDIFKLRYSDYFPQGLNLDNETAEFIKESFNTLISKL